MHGRDQIRPGVAHFVIGALSGEKLSKTRGQAMRGVQRGQGLQPPRRARSARCLIAPGVAASVTGTRPTKT